MLGNWVKVYPSGMPIKVSGINEDYVEYKGHGESCWVQPNLIEPIRITDNILEKNGFNRLNSNTWVKYPIITIERKYNNRFEVNIGHEVYCLVIYVHELQNAINMCNLYCDEITI